MYHVHTNKIYTCTWLGKIALNLYFVSLPSGTWINKILPEGAFKKFSTGGYFSQHGRMQNENSIKSEVRDALFIKQSPSFNENQRNYI